MRKLSTSLAVVLLLGGSAVHAQRSDYGPALQFTGTPFGRRAAEGNYGWTFSVVSPGFLINQMGIWDIGSDGLVNTHDVGLWRGSTLIATTTVGPSSTGVLTNGIDLWRVNSIPELLLTPGDYTIAAHYLGADPDDFVVNATSVTTIPELVYGTAVQSGFVGTPTKLEFESLRPDLVDTPGFFGPIIGHVNGGTAAPEPGALSLMALGLGSVGLVARRRMKASVR